MERLLQNTSLLLYINYALQISTANEFNCIETLITHQKDKLAAHIPLVNT